MSENDNALRRELKQLVDEKMKKELFEQIDHWDDLIALLCGDCEIPLNKDGTGPNPRHYLFQCLMEPCNVITHEDFLTLLEHGYFDAPASKGHHLNYEGGLFDHSMNVTMTLLELSANNGIVWERWQSPIIVGVFHDLCKMDAYYREYKKTGLYENDQPVMEPGEIKWNPCQLYSGHGDKSAMLAGTYCKLTEEELACIRYHMGAFTDQKEWDNYTRACELYPTVMWTHMADMIAAHQLEVRISAT